MTVETGEWEVFDEELPLLGSMYGGGRVRMTVVGVGGGDLLVVSPGKMRDESRFAALERYGTPRWLLAPNHFHNGGLAAWKKRYPDIRVVAHQRAHARLSKKVPEVGLIEGLEALEARLPPHVRVFGPPMAKQGETWIEAKTKSGNAWLVCDAVMNQDTVSWPFWLLGFRPRLMTNPLFKRLFLDSKSDYVSWMNEQLAKSPPDLLIPSHGSVVRGADLVTRLRRITTDG